MSVYCKLFIIDFWLHGECSFINAEMTNFDSSTVRLWNLESQLTTSDVLSIGGCAWQWPCLFCYVTEEKQDAAWISFHSAETQPIQFFLITVTHYYQLVNLEWWRHHLHLSHFPTPIFGVFATGVFPSTMNSGSGSKNFRFLVRRRNDVPHHRKTCSHILRVNIFSSFVSQATN